MKPKVDVGELAHKGNNGTYPIDEGWRRGFEEGYNAKEAEFTREDMELAWKAGSIHNTSVGFDNFESFLNNIRQLSLPTSVTLNENNEVTHVEW